MSANVDLMIDLEALGQDRDATILSIGAVKFDDKDILTTFKTNVTIKSQVKDRAIDPSTVEWWLKQEKAAQEALFTPTPVALKEALVEFTRYYNATPEVDCVWANGASFDLGILRHAYKGYPPWGFRQEMCMRPVRLLAREAWGLEWYTFGDARRKGVWHDALGDATVQAWYIQEVRRRLRDAK